MVGKSKADQRIADPARDLGPENLGLKNNLCADGDSTWDRRHHEA
jgi:hypothetical protein